MFRPTPLTRVLKLDYRRKRGHTVLGISHSQPVLDQMVRWSAHTWPYSLEHHTQPAGIRSEKGPKYQQYPTRTIFTGETSRIRCKCEACDHESKKIVDNVRNTSSRHVGCSVGSTISFSCAPSTTSGEKCPVRSDPPLQAWVSSQQASRNSNPRRSAGGGSRAIGTRTLSRSILGGQVAPPLGGSQSRGGSRRTECCVPLRRKVSLLCWV